MNIRTWPCQEGQSRRSDRISEEGHFGIRVRGHHHSIEIGSGARDQGSTRRGDQGQTRRSDGSGEQPCGQFGQQRASGKDDSDGAGQTKTFRDQLQTRLRKTIGRDHPVFSWLIEWAAATLTRFRDTYTERTAFANIKGGESRTPIAIFGEKYYTIH